MTLTFSNLSADTFESSLKAGRKRPRVREAVSCSQCRTRKTRCDRAQPCKQCQYRGVPSECCYGTPKHVAASSPSRRHAKTSPGTQTTSPASAPLQDPDPVPIAPQNHPPALSPPDGENGPRQPNRIFSGPGACPPQSMNSSRNTFRGSGIRTRLVGLSHWMAPSREMIIVKAMLNRSPEFHASQTAFDELKAILRHQGVLPARLLGNGTDGSNLRSLLPERHSCEEWTKRFCCTYNRVYGIVDPAALASDIQQIYDGTVDDPVHVARLLMVTAIAMQNSGQHRIQGRVLAGHVEECVVSSLRFQKPCIGVARNLLLLMLMKTISASDTDKIYDMLVIQGLTAQIFTTMGLHRDPTMFSGVSLYYVEIRKRLWACFLRLSLEYCIRSGSQLTIRLDESDCPPPTPSSLRHLRPETMNEWASAENDDRDAADAAFGTTAARLATIIIPLYQSLNSPNPPDLFALQSSAKAAFGEFSTSLPGHLAPGKDHPDPIVELQRSMLTVTMQSFLTVVRLGETLGASLNPSHRSNLMEAWDHASFVVHHFQRLFQSHRCLETIVFQLLWADVGRAALASCWIVGRLRRLDYGCIIAPHPQQTVRIFHQVLADSMLFLSQLWKARFHLGPVAAKVHLVLTVAWKVTTKLYSDEYDPSSVQQKLIDLAAVTAESLIAEMKLALQKRHLTPTPSDRGVSPASPFMSIGWGDTEIGLAGPLVPDIGGPFVGYDCSSLGYSSGVLFDSLLPSFQFSSEEDMFASSIPQFERSAADLLWE
ncbi:hypothetical protein OQA88_10825 [Cercophora sp. LCS_1]